MRVCIITSANFPPEEGVGTYIYNMSSELIKKGYEITIFTRGGLNKATKINLDGIEIYKTPFIPLYPFHVHIHGLFTNPLFNSLEPQFDIVHYHTPLPPIVDTKLPIITTMHSSIKKSVAVDTTPLTTRLQSKISYKIERKIVKSSNIVTCVSKSVLEELLTEYGQNSEDVSVIGNGVNEKLFYPIESQDCKPYILFTGRITYQKGIIEFIECAKQICKKYDNIDFKIAGKGPLMGMSKKLIAESKYRDRFDFLGHIEHSNKSRLVSLYQNASIFILPSHYEGLPTTLLEAMSCGIPVIATSIKATTDLIVPEKNGILIPVNSPNIMADKVSYLLDNPDIRLALGKSARATILNNYTWEKITSNIMNCYESLY